MEEERKEITISVVPEVLETLEAAAAKRNLDLQVFIRLILNEWVLKYENQ